MSTDNFSLTGKLVQKTDKWDYDAKNFGLTRGRLSSRAVNLLTAPTALVDTVVHLAAGILTTFTGAGILGSLTNLIAGRHISPITFTSGLKHIAQAFKHALCIPAAPICGLISPATVNSWFNLTAEKAAKKAVEDAIDDQEDAIDDQNGQGISFFLNDGLEKMFEAQAAREAEIADDLARFQEEVVPELMREAAVEDDLAQFQDAIAQELKEEGMAAREAEIADDLTQFQETIAAEVAEEEAGKNIGDFFTASIIEFDSPKQPGLYEKIKNIFVNIWAPLESIDDFEHIAF